MTAPDRQLGPAERAVIVRLMMEFRAFIREPDDAAAAAKADGFIDAVIAAKDVLDA